jgi:hypothetical protein
LPLGLRNAEPELQFSALVIQCDRKRQAIFRKKLRSCTP